MSFLPPLPPNFEAALRDVRAKDPKHRLAAAEQLANAPDERIEDAVEALSVLLEDASGPLRQAAVTSLGELAQPSSLARLLAAVDDAHSGVRQAAITASARVGGDEARDAIVALLDDERPEMRFQAVLVLALVAPDGLGRLTSRLEDEDDEVRAAAAQLLGEHGVVEAADALATCLDDPKPHVANCAALALADLQDDRGVALLRKRVEDRGIGIEAALALGKLGAEEAKMELGVLVERYLAPLPLKAAAAASLHQLNDPRGVEGLRGVLTAFRADGRSFAAMLAGDLGIHELAPELAVLVGRPRGIDPGALAQALDKLAAKSPVAAEALARLTAGTGAMGDAARIALDTEPTQ